MPSGLYLLGSRAGDESNLMTANWVTQVASQPKLVAASVEAEAVTHRLISEGGAFTVCILDRADRAVVRKFARPAERDPETGALNGFEVFAARTGAPLFAGAAAWLDCEVRHRLELGSHTLFVGEVVDCGPPPGADAEVLRMEDTRMNYGG
jgi:flavin reductase (DIM6/NTAB) family NADH-FMN oxidoreductase RutF